MTRHTIDYFMQAVHFLVELVLEMVIVKHIGEQELKWVEMRLSRRLFLTAFYDIVRRMFEERKTATKLDMCRPNLSAVFYSPNNGRSAASSAFTFVMGSHAP